MAAVSRAWFSEVARPTTARLTRRAAQWTAQSGQVAAQHARGAARRAHSASRRVADSLALARASSERCLRDAQQELRSSVMPAAGAQAKRLTAYVPMGVLLSFLGSVATGAVYGLSGSGAQTLTTGVCALTLLLLFSGREAQQREALALRRSLDELRNSLRVTHALLEASELQGAEELRSTLLPAAPAESRAAQREAAEEHDETRRISAVAIV